MLFSTFFFLFNKFVFCAKSGDKSNFFTNPTVDFVLAPFMGPAKVLAGTVSIPIAYAIGDKHALKRSNEIILEGIAPTVALVGSGLTGGILPAAAAAYTVATTTFVKDECKKNIDELSNDK